MNTLSKPFKAFRSTAKASIHTLLAVFVFGIIVNLFVELPTNLPGGNAWMWSFTNSPLIVIHVILGTLLTVLSLVTVIFSMLAHTKQGIIASVFGLLFTMLAYATGAQFLSAAQTNVSSLLMALGFLGALISYGLGVYLTKGEGKVKAI